MDPERAQQVTRTVVTAAVGQAMTGNTDYEVWLTSAVWGADVSVANR